MKKRIIKIIEVLLFFALIAVIIYILKGMNGKYANPSIYKANLKSAVAELNQVLAATNMKTDKGTLPYDTSEKLTKFFKQNLKVTKYSLKSNEVYTSGNIKYTFFSKGKCGDAFSTEDPEKANCVVLIDTNGDEEPNTLSAGNSAETFLYSDQYKFVIKEKTIVPAVSKTNTIALEAFIN